MSREDVIGAREQRSAAVRIGAVLLMSVVLLTGATGCGVPTGTPTPSVSAPSTAPAEAAARHLEGADLTLPDDAVVTAVDDTPLPPFEGAVLITFTAPRSAVLAWCESSGLATFADAVIGPQDREVLRGHGDTAGAGLCSRDDGFGQGTAIRVAVNADDQHAIALYSVPGGR